jgi:hypothetical protein
MINKTQTLKRAYRTIDSCRTEAQIQCAIVYKDLCLKTLYPNDPDNYNKWDEKMLKRLNDKALVICGLIE